MPRRRERGRRTAAGAGDSVQVDVVRHLAVRAVHEVELHFVILPDADELARHAAAEGPERIVHTVGHALHQFDDFELDGDL